MFQLAFGEPRGSTHETRLAASNAQRQHTHKTAAMPCGILKQIMVATPGNGGLTGTQLKCKGRLPPQWMPSQIPEAKGEQSARKVAYPGNGNLTGE